MTQKQWSFFFFNDTATTEIYTLSLHDALPITRIRMAAQLEVGARPALVFMTDVARAHVARQPEDFNRSMKGRCFVAGHDCTSEAPQYYPRRLYSRRNSRRTDLSGRAVFVRLR